MVFTLKLSLRAWGVRAGYKERTYRKFFKIFYRKLINPYIGAMQPSKWRLLVLVSLTLGRYSHGIQGLKLAY